MEVTGEARCSEPATLLQGGRVVPGDRDTGPVGAASGRVMPVPAGADSGKDMPVGILPEEAPAICNPVTPVAMVTLDADTVDMVTTGWPVTQPPPPADLPCTFPGPPILAPPVDPGLP